MAYNLSRMTAYALVSALEEDLKEIVKDQLGEQDYSDSKFDNTLVARARARLEKDLGFTYEEHTISNLIDYFDLGDTYQVINKHASEFPSEIAGEIKSRTPDLERIVPIRNRVMHIRPLNFDDLPTVSDFCQELVSGAGKYWINLRDTLRKLEADPSFVMGLKIPNLESEDRISHNLPLPDFDETGLIGRDQIVRQVKKLCLGGFPVISIVGEGGVGKTALALKVAYELLEEENCPFDAVVWVTSKTTQITVNEIRDIRGAISTSVGVFGEISSQLGGAVEEDPLVEIIEYLGAFRIALFIDNLETIMDDSIRRFVSSLPNGSKLVITSRIGLGAYEYPIKLDGIEEKYASQLLRTMGRLRNVHTLATQDEATLRRYVNRMYLNPGYIKWFVSAVQTGLTAEAVLQNSELFLEFCMSNVYQYLSKDAREVTSVMQCAPGWKDIAELSYLTGFEAIKIQKALQELMTTNMLAESSKSTGGSIKTTYQIAELARAYLNKHHRPSNAFQQKIKNNRNKLNSLIEMQGSVKGSNRYAPSNIKARVKADWVIVKMLRDAYRYISEGTYDRAYEILEESRRLAPDYFEVPRVFAYFHLKVGNFQEARESFELAIALAPGTPQLHLWFGRFILREEESVDDAVIQFEAARKLDIKSTEVAVNLVRGYLFQHKFELAEGIILELIGLVDAMDDILRRTYFDARVQLHYRKADDLCQSGDYLGSLESLDKMRIEFDSLPASDKDVFIRRKLPKANVTLQRLLRHFTTGSQQKILLDLQDWLARESRQSPGRQNPGRQNPGQSALP